MRLAPPDPTTTAVYFGPTYYLLRLGCKFCLAQHTSAVQRGRESHWEMLHVDQAVPILLSVLAVLILAVPDRCRGGDETAPGFLIRQWTKEQGLPDNQINAILQTRDGYVWMATRAGLARFDGVRFSVFNRTTAPGLIDDHCTSLAEDAAARVWVGTRAGLWTPHGPHLIWFSRPAESGFNFVYSICSDRENTVWIGCQNGLVRWNQTQVNRFFPSDEQTSIGSAAVQPTGSLLFGTTVGIHQMSPDGKSLVRDVRPSTPRLAIVALSADAHGRVWALEESPKRERRLWCLSNDVWTVVYPSIGANGGRPAFLFADRAGDLWFPGDHGGVLRLRQGRFERVALPETAARAHALCVAEDRDGNFWIGTQSHGVLYLRPKRVRIVTTTDGLPNERVWSITQDRNDVVWIGTQSGVAALDGGRHISFTKNEGLSHETVRVITQDHDGRIWLGTGSGLDCIVGGQVRRYRFAGRWEESKVNSLWAGRYRALWVGTARGLRRVDLGLSSAGIGPGRSSSQPSDEILSADAWLQVGQTEDPVSVKAVLEDRHGDVWCAVPGRGLYRLRDGALTLFDTRHGLSSDRVWALHEGRDGALWIASDRGLNYHMDGRFSVLTRREGLFDDFINQVVEDDAGNLWIGSDRGIGRVSKRDVQAVLAGRAQAFHCTRYDSGDGLPVEETNGQRSDPTAWKSRDGRIWFPTPKGAVVFEPKNLPDLTSPPSCVIEQVRSNGKPVYENATAPTGPLLMEDLLRGGFRLRPAANAAGSPIASKSAMPLSALRIPPGGAHLLEIQYTANTFASADQLRFKYRLQGLDKGWVDAGARRSAYYANLQPGHYRFQVLAQNKYGVWDEAGASLAIHLQPYLFETSWFYAILAGALASAILGFYRWRLGYVRRIHWLEKDAALAHDRARIAKDLHDGLGAQLTRLTILAEMSDRRNKETHGLEERLRQLSRLARETVLQLKEVIWANHPGDETLEGLASRICHYAEQSLCPAGIPCRFRIAEDMPPLRLNVTARHNLFLVAKEALNNILKHAEATEVRLEFQVTGNAFCVAIIDNGHGLPPPSPLCNNQSPTPTGNHGLRNMRDRIEGLNGHLRIGGMAGAGTTIHFEVPLPKLRAS